MKQTFYLALGIAFTSFVPLNNIQIHPQNMALGMNAEAGKWVLDKAQSSVTFSVSHLLVRTAEGHFKVFDGTMECTKPDFSDARINFTVDAASIDTDNEGRDEHLKSDDYFSTEKYPKIRFESTSFKPSGGKNYKLTGKLTLKDVTKTVVFNVVYEGTTPNKEPKATFKCTTTINRYDFNVSSGGAAIGKEVTINVKAEMNKVK